MLLSDSEIRELTKNGILTNAKAGSINQVTCDLTTDAFITDGGEKTGSVRLAPGESAFVQCVEGVSLPADLAACITLRNSRIRQGLTLDAPLYFPGHSTVLFFRVTNISAGEISLSAVDGLAQVSFERVDKPVEKTYDGTFQAEMDYSGMGKYTGAYEAQMRGIEKKADEVKGVERRMYANVIAIMAIIAGIFTLVNVNVQAIGGDLSSVLVANLSTVGSFAALVALIAPLAWKRDKTAIMPLCVAAVCFAAAIACAVLL